MFIQLSVSDKSLYQENSKDVAEVIRNMATLPFLEIEQKDGGTQFKLTVEFPDGSQALLKPMRHPREQVTFYMDHMAILNISISSMRISLSLLFILFGRKLCRIISTLLILSVTMQKLPHFI